MIQLKAFYLGLIEFRQQCTTSYDYPLIETYDRARELMHRITFRAYDYGHPIKPLTETDYRPY
jgi:hypothetical protein